LDYFSILGVKVDATPDEIKRAYRQKARQFHPDLNDAPDAEDQFRLVSEAYRVLSDAKQRAAYVQTRIQAQAAVLDKRITRRKPRSHYKSSHITLHIGYLLVGVIMVAWVMDRGAFFVAGARSSMQMQCAASGWQPLADGERFRMSYTGSIPGQSTIIESSAVLDGRPAAYDATSFTCYYIESTAALRLDPYGLSDVLRLMPWGALGVFMVVQAGRFFFA
jgi:curved DNA-binding protein CbpA